MIVTYTKKTEVTNAKQMLKLLGNYYNHKNKNLLAGNYKLKGATTCILKLLILVKLHHPLGLLPTYCILYIHTVQCSTPPLTKYPIKL